MSVTYSISQTSRAFSVLFCRTSQPAHSSMMFSLKRVHTIQFMVVCERQTQFTQSLLVSTMSCPRRPPRGMTSSTQTQQLSPQVQLLTANESKPPAPGVERQV